MTSMTLSLSRERPDADGWVSGRPSSVAARRLGPPRMRATLDGAGRSRGRRGSYHGCVLTAGQGQAPPAKPRWRRAFRRGWAHHHQQDVWFGDEGGHARP